ncbi:MAG TPA: CBS domain-containing protein, partial [Pyrinomonadaceae bacterium]|nr:CBS domain-containing protein [Pyrinomonadaceae bacterium]
IQLNVSRVSHHSKRFFRSIQSMSGESASSQTPSVAVAKTASTQKARADRVSMLECEDYVCIPPTAPLSEAIEAMKTDEGGCAIVCESDRTVVGVFTERDLLTKIIGQDVEVSAPVSRWMSPVVATLSPDATIGEAVTIMNDKGYRNIPLVKDGKLVGSISVFDIIRYLSESYPKTTINLPPNTDQVMESRDGG